MCNCDYHLILAIAVIYMKFRTTEISVIKVLFRECNQPYSTNCISPPPSMSCPVCKTLYEEKLCYNYKNLKEYYLK